MYIEFVNGKKVIVLIRLAIWEENWFTVNLEGRCYFPITANISEVVIVF